MVEKPQPTGAANGVGRYRITHKSGVVQHIQNFTKVSSSSTGGGGMLTYGSGYIAAPSVSVTSTTWQRVFVSDDRGGEWQFEVNDGFAVRPGNHVKASYAARASGKPVLGFVRNLDSNDGWRWPMSSILPRYSTVLLIGALIILPVWWMEVNTGIIAYLLQNALWLTLSLDAQIPFIHLVAQYVPALLLGCLPMIAMFRWWRRRSTRQMLWDAMAK